MVSFVAVGDPPLPEPPDPPDPPNPLSIFAQTSISNPSSISLPCSPLHHPLLSTSDLDLGFTIPSYGDIFFALMRCFPAKCSSWFQIYSEICLLLVGVKAKSVGCVVSLSMWPVLCTSQLARRSRGNFSLMAVAKRSSFPLMVVTRRLLLTEIGSDVFVNLSLAPFAPLSSRSFCFASIASLSFILNLSSESLSYSSLAQTRQCFLTYVRCGMNSFLVLSLIPNLVIVRFITAVCSLFEFNMAFGAMILVSLPWWQFESKSVIKFSVILDADLILSDHLNGDSGLPCIEVFVRHVLILLGFVPISSNCAYVFAVVKWEVQSLFRAEPPHLFFPKFPLDWCGLDDQASPVLQGSSSRLIVSFAFVAKFVILRVAVDAVTHEACGIVLFRSPLASFVDLYLPSIISVSSFGVFSGFSSFVILFITIMWFVISPLLCET